MSKALKAAEIISLIENGLPPHEIKQAMNLTNDEWFKYSSVAYRSQLNKENNNRKIEAIGRTSRQVVSDLINLNDVLADYAMLLPTHATMAEYEFVQVNVQKMPGTEYDILNFIGQVTMYARYRVLQKKGRFEKFAPFSAFYRLIDAATLSYYRANYISSYLTLVPVIEGVIARWGGFQLLHGQEYYESIRNFFNNRHKWHPYPSNILFHNIFVKACSKILNNHLYSPTTRQNYKPHANFNRHIAAHLLNDDNFGTRWNCIRLFILLDAMSEIYLYESRETDPRFNLKEEELQEEINLLNVVHFSNSVQTAEQIILCQTEKF